MPDVSLKEKMSGVDIGRKRKGLMITPELCIGCRGCQSACKQWNKLPGDKTMNRGVYENPPNLTANLYNQIHFIEQPQDVGIQWLFVRRACMHCGEAGCMDICPAPGAISRTKEGAVVFDKIKCIGSDANSVLQAVLLMFHDTTKTTRYPNVPSVLTGYLMVSQQRVQRFVQQEQYILAAGITLSGWRAQQVTLFMARKT
jgi:Fe-S-cluster-containing hydrogenase component 2